MLSRLESGDTFDAYALDRLSRDQIDAAILIDSIEGSGASLQLVTEDFEKPATGPVLRSRRSGWADDRRECPGFRPAAAPKEDAPGRGSREWSCGRFAGSPGANGGIGTACAAGAAMVAPGS
jgi:hypothetical protein